MTTGAVFKLIANDGKADRMIMATKLLFQRIQEVIYQRTKQGKADITPTLADLERTHILYINAHFKPFAAIGYEYQKVKPQSGTSTLGGSVTFSIPQFGDFFHDMVCRVRLGKVYAATGQTPTQDTLANAVKGTAFPSNTATTSYNIVDHAGNVIVAGATGGAVAHTYRNFVRYCEFPGNKLFTKVKFEVNGNPLDEYDQYVPVMLEKFTVMPHKRSGYNTLIGQQNKIEGVSGLQKSSVFDTDNTVQPALKQLDIYGQSVSGADQATLIGTKHNTPSGIDRFGSTQSNQTTALYQPLTTTTRGPVSALVLNETPLSLVPGTIVPIQTALNAPILATATVGSDMGTALDFVNDNQLYDLSQRSISILNGPQTAKPIQPPLEIWNKLKFWFNDDVRLSIPSVSIPFGMRFITIDLAPASALVYETPSIFLETITQSNVVATSSPVTSGNVVPVTFKPTNALPASVGSFNAAQIYAAGFAFIPANATTYAVIATSTLTNGTNSATAAQILTAGLLYDTTTSSFSGTTITTTGTGTPTITAANFTSMGATFLYSDLTTAEVRSYSPIFNRNGLAADPAIEQIELYINNIFVSPEVHDIFIRRIGFALIRVYRQQKSTLTASGTQELLLSALKWPVEYMFVGLQPTFNVKEATTASGLVTGGNVNTWRDWHRMTRQIEATCDDLTIATTATVASRRGAVDPAKYWLPVPTVDSLSLVTHGINIFDNFSDLFFSAYSPYHYGQSTITTPEDVGAYFVNMSLFPRAYQPGGHLNISRVRETYLKFVSSYCGSKSNCAAIIVAVCINFLITSDGSAMLRYST